MEGGVGETRPGELVSQSIDAKTDVCFSFVVINAVMLLISQLLNLNSPERGAESSGISAALRALLVFTINC